MSAAAPADPLPAPRAREGPGGPIRALGAGDRVVVTGAAGFIGSAVVRALLGRGAHVVATVGPSGDAANLEGLPVERVTLDVRHRASVASVVRAARAVFHLAAVYRFWAPEPSVFYDVNVLGTRNVIDAAVAAGVEGVVYTSTVSTIGLRGSVTGRPATEEDHAEVAHLFGAYKQSKYVAEHEVLRAAAEGAPVCLVLPAFPLGPGDRRPTPTGKLVLDFLNGRMPAYVDTAMNVVHVDDLATAHVLAFEHGRHGRSYIAGGENLTMRRLLELVAATTGLPPVRMRLPTAAGLGAAHLSQLLQARMLGREPSVPLEAARMSATPMIFDDRRARTELGYRSRPAVEAIEASARWFVDHGYVRPVRSARIEWRPAGLEAEELGLVEPRRGSPDGEGWAWAHRLAMGRRWAGLARHPAL